MEVHHGERLEWQTLVLTSKRSFSSNLDNYDLSSSSQKKNGPNRQHSNENFKSLDGKEKQ